MKCHQTFKSGRVSEGELKYSYFICFFVFLILPPFSSPGWANTVKYELVIRNEKVNLSGKKDVDFALTVNGRIPAPTLEFTEGDDAEILVKNEVQKEEVSIHWHGILLPPEEDGVAYSNTPPIHPGASRLFKFKIRQNGTYWYHSHTAVQEQKGVYGAFIIHPRKKIIIYDKEAVVLISDWSDENADQILRNLRKSGDYYLYKKKSIRSYIGAIRAGGLASHLYNEWSRMGGMDLSDVGYDAFLINGRRDSQLLTAEPGERIRLRIINAGASSYFYISLAGLPMTVISADGVNVQPVRAKELLLGMAETYDVLFTVPERKNYELRATAQDITGFASTWIGTGEKVASINKPMPYLYTKMDHSMATDSGGMNHESHGTHSQPTSHEQHKNHDHHEQHEQQEEPIDWSTQSGAILNQNSALVEIESGNSSVDTLTVDSLRSLKPTAFPKELSEGGRAHDIKLVLGGDMSRYIWYINGKVIYEDRWIFINKGEVVRFNVVNETMMHHPIHFHGHFFRVINENGVYSPLKHTVDIPPHGSRFIEFYANEPGQWMLHCHNLYHMKTGMARFVRYNGFKLAPDMVANEEGDPHMHDHIYPYARIEVAGYRSGVNLKLMRTWEEIDFDFESSGDRRNFLFGQERETSGGIYYRYRGSSFFNFFAGGSLYKEKRYGIVGMGYLLPMSVDSSLSVNQEKVFRLSLEKRFQWTQHVFSQADVVWHSRVNEARDIEYKVSLMYEPSWTWAAGLMITEGGFDVGVQVQF